MQSAPDALPTRLQRVALRARSAALTAGAALACASVAAAGVVAGGVAPASAAVPSAVYQGMPFVVDGTDSLCTIGYNDADNQRSFTAAHCGADGAGVRLVDPSDYTKRSPVLGHLRISPLYSDLQSPNDWGYIEWDDNVRLAANNITGDTLIRPSEVRPGEKVCFHGATTHRGTLGSHCGRAAADFGHELFAIGVTGQKGDSGGPVFIPGRGMVGVMSGHLNPKLHSPRDGGERVQARFLRATYPEDGPADTVQRFKNWALTRYLAERTNPGVVSIDDTSIFLPSGTPGPTAPAYEGYPLDSPQNASATGSSSNGALSPGAIIGYLLLIVAAAAPLAGQILGFF